METLADFLNMQNLFLFLKSNSYQDSGDLRKESGQDTLRRITDLVNDTVANEGSHSFSTLTTDDVLKAIDSGKSEGGSVGRHWVLDPIDGTKGYVSFVKQKFVVLTKIHCAESPSRFCLSDDITGL